MTKLETARTNYDAANARYLEAVRLRTETVKAYRAAPMGCPNGEEEAFLEADAEFKAALEAVDAAEQAYAAAGGFEEPEDAGELSAEAAEQIALF